MNWQTVLGFPDSADWILLTAFHSLWLSLTVCLILRFRKFRSPVVRSPWCTCTLILLLALPLITWSIPRFAVRAQPAQTTAVGISAGNTETQAPLLNKLLNVDAPLPQASLSRWKVRMTQLGMLWLAVTSICLGRLLYQLVFLKGYCTGIREIRDGRLYAVLNESKYAFHFRSKPRFFASYKLKSPISTGIWTPLVILPAKLYQSIGDKELRAILLHELAHIYHHDHVLGLLQRLVKALYWWNPLVYQLCNSLSVAREEVSDNYAISGMESAAGYARLLVSLVEKTSLVNRMPCAAGMATPYESLETRIKGIVSKERDMRVRINRRMLSLILLTSVLLCLVVVAGSQVQVFGVAHSFVAGQKAKEPPAAPAPKPMIKVDGKIMVSKKLIHKVDPVYPELALKARVQGKVLLEVTVDAEGLVSGVQVTRGHPLLDEAAVKAVRQWKFSPTLLNGKGVPVVTNISIVFNLDKHGPAKFVISGSER